ncbi:MAG: hypothetical protein AAF481_12420 [Acidobacteriota bacterium]
MINRQQLVSAVLGVSMVWLSSSPADAGAFIGASDANPDRILHPRGYDGTGGVVTVGICIDPDSIAVSEMEIPLRNVIAVWNALEPTTGNVRRGDGSELDPDQIDWESTILHEVGHCIGLSHPNLASESPVASADRNYTKTGAGPNGVFDLDAGADGVKGSADDVRGDDLNRHWYQNGVNNPFTLPATVDFTTYSRTLENLPPGDLFPANGDLTVSALYGVPNTEASMQQGARSGEEQRTLVADDVATLRLGMSGLDEIAGTADDYTVHLVYAGVSDSCDLVVRLINTSSFAFCSSSRTTIEGNHQRITSSSVTTGDFNWFFTTERIGGEEIFSDGFESGDTTLWTAAIR